MERLSVEWDGVVAVVRLGHGVPNGIDPLMVTELDQTLRDLQGRAGGLVLAGGRKFFSMGFHLPTLLGLTRADVSDFLHKFTQACLILADWPGPTAAAVVGHAPAGGTVLAIPCDYRFVAAGRTVLGINEVKIGLFAPPVLVQLLANIVGPRAATLMAMTGEFLGPERALELGLADEVLPADQVEVRARERVAALAALPPQALVRIKHGLTTTAREVYRAEGPAMEAAWVDLFFSSETRRLLTEVAEKF